MAAKGSMSCCLPTTVIRSLSTKSSSMSQSFLLDLSQLTMGLPWVMPDLEMFLENSLVEMLQNLVPDFLQVTLEVFSAETLSGMAWRCWGLFWRVWRLARRSGPKTRAGFFPAGAFFRTLKVVGPQDMSGVCDLRRNTGGIRSLLNYIDLVLILVRCLST